jgi:sialate O-acetylesterase
MKIELSLLRLVIILTVLFASSLSSAEVRLPRLISHGMVMQRDTKVNVWGWASADEKITVQFRDKVYSAVADEKGNWSITLPVMKAGGPYTMKVAGSNTIEINNILIGDVWICSGQSNMALPMERVKERYASVIANAENSSIRHFFLATQYNFKKAQEDIPSGSWMSATPENVLKFSATAYFFAKSLYEKYRVPIGLINASVGGSPAEAWLSADALRNFPEYFKEAERFKNDALVDSIQNTERSVSRTWYNTIYRNDKGNHEQKKWYDTAYNDAHWPVMNIPGYWHDQGLKDLNGVVWFRKEFNVPANMVGKSAKLYLGCIVDSDSVYVNGRMVGTIGYRYPPRRYTIPEQLLKPGKNVIVIRVINNTGKGGFVEDKAYQITDGKETIDLRGPWKHQVGTVAQPLAPTTFMQYKPGGLFNAMISPLLHFPIKGVIWYQGESNTARAASYQAIFSALIVDWRKHWKQGNFPFLYVQLSNYAPVAASESGWPELRDAQLKTLSVPQTAMAVTIDIGEWNDLHPLNKEDVGKRLALAAQYMAYGDKKAVYSGPIYQSKEIKGDKIILHFTNVGSGLISRNNEPLKYFEIAGPDKKFFQAQTRINGNTITVWSEQVTNPATVRYAWTDNPQGANLYNKEGLPASPFTAQ